jgi:hypothetical protein
MWQMVFVCLLSRLLAGQPTGDLEDTQIIFVGLLRPLWAGQPTGDLEDKQIIFATYALATS